MKKLLLLMVAMALGLSAVAAEIFNIVTINRTDGVAEQLMLHKDLKIKMSGKSTLLLIHPEITVEYEVPELQSLTFDYLADAPLYNGDHESRLVETPVGSQIQISAEAISGAAGDRIEAYDLNGHKIADTTGSLRLATLQPGAIYIVRIGSTSLKIKR